MILGELFVLGAVSGELAQSWDGEGGLPPACSARIGHTRAENYGTGCQLQDILSVDLVCSSFGRQDCPLHMTVLSSANIVRCSLIEAQSTERQHYHVEHNDRSDIKGA